MGKFSSTKASRYYSKSLDGMHDEECGDVQSNGTWYGLFRKEKIILTEDSQGFVDISEFATLKEIDAAWAGIQEACTEFEEGCE